MTYERIQLQAIVFCTKHQEGKFAYILNIFKQFEAFSKYLLTILVYWIVVVVVVFVLFFTSQTIVSWANPFPNESVKLRVLCIQHKAFLN